MRKEQIGACWMGIFDDHVRICVGANRLQVAPLSRQVALLVPLPRGLDRADPGLVTENAAPYRLVEAGRDENPKVPQIVQFRPKEKDAIDEQDGIRQRLALGCVNG
ncbi:MAG: hypothetical protein ACREOS_00035 [Candidatus Dormibacteraceae bacterium]